MAIKNKQALSLALRNLIYYYGLDNLERMVTSSRLRGCIEGNLDYFARDILGLDNAVIYEKQFKESESYNLLKGLKSVSDIFVAGLNMYQNDKSELKDLNKKNINEGIQVINNYFKSRHALRSISTDGIIYLPDNTMLVSNKILNNNTISLVYITLYLRLSGAKFVNIVWHIYNINSDTLLELNKNIDQTFLQILVNLKCFNGTIEDLNPQILNPDRMAERGIAVAQSSDNTLTLMSLFGEFKTVNYSKQQLLPYIKDGDFQGVSIENGELIFKGGAL